MVSRSNSSPLFPIVKSVKLGRAWSLGFCSSRSVKVLLNQKQKLFGSPFRVNIPTVTSASVAGNGEKYISCSCELKNSFLRIASKHIDLKGRERGVLNMQYLHVGIYM